MKLNVPYYSQYLDIHDLFWVPRGCGATSLKMVAEFHEKTVPDIVTLCNEAKERGGYDMVNGWVHDYLVTKAQEFGLEAHRSEGLSPITDEIIKSLDAGNPVIVSVEKRVLEQTKFHIIVIVGYDRPQIKQTDADFADITDSYKLQANSCFYYHEPESTDKTKGAYRMCDMATFINYWRGKAIFISK